MALQKTVLSSFGFEAQGAYHRVEGLQLLTKTQIGFQVRAYKNASGVPFFAEQQHSCAYDLDGNNPIAQAYEYLKTLSDFENAADC
jgi:hypothetical protein